MEAFATALDGGPDRTAVGAPEAPVRGRPRWLWPTTGVVLLLIVAAVVIVVKQASGGPAPITQADVNRAVATGIARAQQEARNAPPDAGTAYQRVLPSLVTVNTSAGHGTELGAGVVVDARGSVLTALHVVAGGGPIQVRFADGTLAAARIVERQPASDIAVLTTDRLPSVVVPAVLGGGVQVGTAVYPVGHPLGLEGTLTAGVVSGLNRSIRSGNGRVLTGLIQFDAAVNPGNSGGPLLDRDGHVVGIVTALANPSNQPYFIGIGFAVPIATAGGVAGGPQK